jgi:ubiquinone/menaquinone biosynthesis C-methylase UbiE
MLEEILSDLRLGKDGVYSYEFKNTEQDDEIKLRESVASLNYQNYLQKLSYHHSVPVMDKEVNLFLKKIPKNGIIVDVGGCWGWHWRRISNVRPDITVFIVDFVRSNFIHAKNILGDQINDNIFLVHGDATSLIFKENTFDGWWSVQTLQHIPNFKKAVSEARRVLKPGGVFANYSLNNQALIKLIYKMRGRQYHTKGQVPGSFYLALASYEQLKQVEDIFSNRCKKRYSEVIFSPELKIKFPGKEKSIIGRIDSYMSSSMSIFSWVARQQSFHTFKISS